MNVLDRLRAREARARAAIDTPVPSDAGEMPASAPAGTVFCRLAANAQSEYRRLTVARSLMGAAPTGSTDEERAVALLTRSKRSRTRLALRSRVILFMQTTLLDDEGEVIGRHLTPIVFRSRRIRWTIDLLDEIGSHVVDPAAHSWLAMARAEHETFWSTRLRREQSLAALAVAADSSAVQRGLFDVRADLDKLSADRSRSDAASESERHVEAARQSLSLRLQPMQVVLVLLP
jgi:hypothetical protein